MRKLPKNYIIYAKKKPLARLLILFRYFNIHPHSKGNLRL